MDKKITNLQWNTNENGIVWRYDSKTYKIDTLKPPFSVIKLVDSKTLAIVFSNEEYGINNAYLYDAKGNIKCRLEIPNTIKDAICFYEIYYMLDELNAIIVTRAIDYACVINESTYEYERIHITK